MQMNVGETPVIVENEGKLYRKRAYAEISRDLDEFQLYISGTNKPLELSEDERKELLEWENNLGEELEGYFSMVIREMTLNVDFMMTERGREIWKHTTGKDLSKERQLCKCQLYEESDKLAELENEKIVALRGESDGASDLELAGKVVDYGLGKTDQNNWENSIETVDLLIDTNKLLEKYHGLQQMRVNLRKALRESGDGNVSNFNYAKNELRKLYLARINELLAELMLQVYVLVKKREVAGDDALNSEERLLLGKVKKSKSLTATLSRIDKFLYGASEKVDSDGNYEQVSDLVHGKILAAMGDKDGAGNFVMKTDMGLERKLLLEKNVKSGQRAEWGCRVLASYGLLSQYDAQYYLDHPDAPAPDLGWQYVPRPDVQSKSVDSVTQCVKDPEKKTENLIYGLVVSCAHEVEGHVLQNVNKKQISLRLFDRVGGDRRGLMSEAGALYLESRVLRDALGMEKSRNTTYVRAMKRKLAGGHFADCLEDIVSPIISAKRAKYRMDDEAEAEKCRVELVEAVKKKIPSVKRVFHKAGLLENDRKLTKSKDTVYVEQEILMEELERRGLEKLAFIGGLNVSSMLVLVKLGLFDPAKMIEPHLETMKIWREIESGYRKVPSEGVSGDDQKN